MFPEKWYFKNSSFWHFNSRFVLETFILDYWEKIQLFDGMINVTLFDEVEEHDYCQHVIQTQKICMYKNLQNAYFIEENSLFTVNT